MNNKNSAPLSNILTILMLQAFLFLSLLWYAPQMSVERKIFILIFTLALNLVGNIHMKVSYAPNIFRYIFFVVSSFFVAYVIVAMWYYSLPIFNVFKYIYFAIDGVFIMYMIFILVVNLIHWLKGEKYVISTYELQFCFYPFAFVAFALA